jgi:type I restriction enzyme S subunit
MTSKTTKRAVAPSPQNSNPPPLAGGGRGRGSARVSEHAVQSEPLAVREGPVTPYIATPQQSRHSRAGGNPVVAAEQWPFDSAAISQSDKGRRMKQRDYLESGAIPVIDQGQDFIGGYTDDDQMAYDGELPVVLFGDHTRAVKYVNQRFAVGADGIKIFRPADGLSPKYFYYWLKSARLPDRGYGRHYQFLRQLSVPVPEPDEQHRIVAELETQLTRLDASVTALKRVQANLKRYRAGVLKAACEGRLFDVTGGAATSTGLYGPPAKLPAGWRWTTPIEICSQVVDCHNKTAPYTNSGIPLVRTSNIRDGRIDLGDTRFVNQATYEFWSRRCPPLSGDILFTREAPMGEAGVVPDGVTLCMGQRMMLMRPSKEILGRYLLAAVLAPGLRAHIERVAVGSGVKHLRVRDVENLPLPLPPLSEQHRIVAEVERRLSVTEELEAAVAANLKRAERLRQSLLKMAFGN